MQDGWRGIFTIAATPYDERGVLLFEDLAREVDWIIRAGSHGIVWPVGHSEFTSLSFEERLHGTEVVVEAAEGRVPVIIGCSAQCEPDALAFTRRAAECHADGVVAMLPRGFKAANYGLARAYYEQVARGAELPVFIQNQGPPWPALSAAMVVRLCQEIEGVEYVKEEKPPQSRSCQEILDLCGDAMRGVFSGGGCSQLINEMKRGISGCMPGAPIPDICAQVWNLWQDGRHEEAYTLHTLQVAYMNAWRGMPQGARKWVLVRRGAISTAFVRNQGIATLDTVDDEELARAVSLLEPYFIV